MKVKMSLEFEFEHEALDEPGVVPSTEIHKIFKLFKEGYNSQPYQIVKLNEKYAWIIETDPDYNYAYPDYITGREEDVR